MSTTTLLRLWTAPGPLRALMAATEPARSCELHPLIQRVSEIEGDEYEQTWVIEERVPLLFFSIPNRYKVRRTLKSPNQIVMEAWNWPSIYILHTLDLLDKGHTVDVQHTVGIEAPAALIHFVAQTAQTAHDRWIENVQAWIAAHP